MLANQSRKRDLFRQWEGIQATCIRSQVIVMASYKNSTGNKINCKPSPNEIHLLLNSQEMLISQLSPPLFHPYHPQVTLSTQRHQVHLPFAHALIDSFLPPFLHYLLIEKTLFSRTWVCHVEKLGRESHAGETNRE